jgi:hypothetical protein
MQFGSTKNSQIQGEECNLDQLRTVRFKEIYSIWEQRSTRDKRNVISINRNLVRDFRLFEL